MGPRRVGRHALFCVSLGCLLVDQSIFGQSILRTTDGFGAAGVSHDSPRAKRAHLRVPAFKNTTKNSTRRHPERQKKNENAAGKGKTAKFWAVRRREVRRRVSGAGGSKGVQTNQNHNNTNTARSGGRPNPEEVWPRREERRLKGSGPVSPGSGFGSEGLGFRSENRSLGLWVWALLGSQNLAKTLKH